VQRFIALFSGDARERIQDRLSKGSRYDPMIRAKLRAAGLPQDMSYLALVESGYDPHAYSRAAAVGMWQFMASTARGAGLRVDWWVDERRDTDRSTEEAVKFLAGVKSEFGSLYLAAAAYNGGPGRVQRGLTRYAGALDGTTGDDAFFALAETNYLPRDTKNYVPQIIATALVAREPARYGLRIESRPPFAYDSLMVPASTPLSAIARASGADIAEIRELNSSVLRGVTPPNDSLLVRVPVGRAPGFDSAFRALEPSDRKAFTRVTSVKGERLATIARRHGLTSKQLAWYNPKLGTLKSGALRIGQTVLIPASSVVDAALDVPDPSIEIYGRSSRRGRASAGGVHVVVRGETLGGIATANHTTVERLVRLNGLRSKTIRVGQKLRVK
jgi:membrane-bound lytic murein transglycosylase D